MFCPAAEKGWPKRPDGAVRYTVKTQLFTVGSSIIIGNPRYRCRYRN